MLNWINSLILGLVEGITEFLPISSTGHLILAGHFLGVEGDVVNTFEIVIQLGAILAVVFLFSHRFAMLFHFDRQRPFSGRRGWALLFVTSLPAMILGFLLHNFIKTHLFNPITVAVALGIGGVGILLAERMTHRHDTDVLDQLTFRQALMVGFFQCLALWPGMSRSASTIIGGLFAGLDRKTAAEYSFIAAVPIMVMATGYDLLKSYKTIHASEIGFFVVGFIAAFLSAIVAIKFFIQLLQRWTLVPFAVYRIVVAMLFFGLMYLYPIR